MCRMLELATATGSMFKRLKPEAAPSLTWDFQPRQRLQLTVTHQRPAVQLGLSEGCFLMMRILRINYSTSAGTAASCPFDMTVSRFSNGNMPLV